MEILIPFLSLVVGVVLGAWYAMHLKRQELILNGIWSAPEAGYRRIGVKVTNQPGLLGIRLRNATYLGWHYWRIEKGLTIDRSPANECRASLLDKQCGRHIASLCGGARC